MVVGDDELDAALSLRVFKPITNAFQLECDSRLASSTPNTSRRASQLSPMAMSTACDRMTPSMRTFP